MTAPTSDTPYRFDPINVEHYFGWAMKTASGTTYSIGEAGRLFKNGQDKGRLAILAAVEVHTARRLFRFLENKGLTLAELVQVLRNTGSVPRERLSLLLVCGTAGESGLCPYGCATSAVASLEKRDEKISVPSA